MPPSEDRLGLSRFHVPLLIYAPGSVEGGTVRDDIASEMDVLPTIAGLTSTPYLNSTLGVDLLDPALDKEHCAFTVHDQSRIPEIGAIGKDFYFRMYADGAQKRLHDLGAAEPIQDTSALHPDEAARLEALCRATFETARYMPYVNAPDKVRR
jgi:arylsulfatase A-like enzyme